VAAVVVGEMVGLSSARAHFLAVVGRIRISVERAARPVTGKDALARSQTHARNATQRTAPAPHPHRTVPHRTARTHHIPDYFPFITYPFQTEKRRDPEEQLSSFFGAIEYDACNFRLFRALGS
jgi:hypothetical protein